MTYKTYFNGSIEDWFSGLTNVVMRYWTKKDLVDYPAISCDYGFFQQLIKVRDRYLVGINTLDEDCEDLRYPCIQYFYLDEIEFTMYQDDQEILE